MMLAVPTGRGTSVYEGLRWQRRFAQREPSGLAGFIEPCLPTSAKRPPSGDGWLFEIRHDGFRCIARKDGKRVRLYSRPGNELTRRFPGSSRWSRG
jgi:ATP-dependent DNA ligase